MSLIENDVFARFLELGPWAVFLILIAWSPGGIWVAEVIRWLRDRNKHPPWGFSIFHWTSAWLGDISLGCTMAIVDVYYRRVEVSSGTFLTSRQFSIATIALGAFATLQFIRIDNKSWGKGNLVNINRIVHLPYFFVITTLLFGAVRVIGYGIIGGNERGLAWLALGLASFWFVALAVDLTDTSPLWHWVQKKWPKETQKDKSARSN